MVGKKKGRCIVPNSNTDSCHFPLSTFVFIIICYTVTYLGEVRLSGENVFIFYLYFLARKVTYLGDFSKVMEYNEVS